MTGNCPGFVVTDLTPKRFVAVEFPHWPAPCRSMRGRCRTTGPTPAGWCAGTWARTGPAGCPAHSETPDSTAVFLLIYVNYTQNGKTSNRGFSEIQACISVP